MSFEDLRLTFDSQTLMYLNGEISSCVEIDPQSIIAIESSSDRKVRKLV